MAKKELTEDNNIAVEKEKRKDPAAPEKPKAADAEEKPKETTVEFLSSLAAVLVTGLFIITGARTVTANPSTSSPRMGRHGTSNSCRDAIGLAKLQLVVEMIAAKNEPSGAILFSEIGHRP